MWRVPPKRIMTYQVPTPRSHERLVTELEALAANSGVPVVRFKMGESKEDIARPFQDEVAAAGRPGLVLVGKAQERTSAWRGYVDDTHAGHRPSHPHMAWRRHSSVPDHWYFYFADHEWGPAFLKVCTYAPYPLWCCANGHEWAKCQLAKAGIGFEALDNGLRSVEDPAAAHRICARLGAGHLRALLARMMAVVPDPLCAHDRLAGFEWSSSIAQLEVSDTAVFDQPRRARAWFEAAIGDHLDLGRPERVSLLVDRRVLSGSKHKTPGRFATEIITRDTAPQLQIHYRSSKAKAYLKEGRALRVETTVNNASDFDLHKTLSAENWNALRRAGADTNARSLATLGEGRPGLPDPATLELIVMLSVGLGAEMSTIQRALSYKVFVAPSKPSQAPTPRFGDPPAWDPITSTLIFGRRDAVLVDSFMTVREATALAAWIELHDRRLTTIYITHGHGDHYSGLSVLLERFPDARAMATKGTVEQMRNGGPTQHPYRACFQDRSLKRSSPNPTLQSTLGSPYEVTTRGKRASRGHQGSAVSRFHCHRQTEQDNGVTKFHVHGGGLVFSRVTNEFGTAKRVASAIDDAFGPRAQNLARADFRRVFKEF